MTGGMDPQKTSPQGEVNPPGSRYQIVPAAWRDLGALRSLEQVCFPQDAWPIWDLIGALTLPNMVRLKAVAGEEMIGFVAADTRHRDKAAWIATVAVLPEYRRQGIGRELMGAAEAQIANPVIRLCVRVSNHGAQEMYRELGYAVHEIWRRYYHDGEDALVMQKIRRPTGETGYNKP